MRLAGRPLAGAFLVLTAALTAASASDEDNTVKRRLYRHLFANYNREVAPSADGSPVKVMIDPQLTSILNVDEAEETIEFAHWWLIWWTDDQLTWNADEWDGVEYLYVRIKDLLWLPDITFFEKLESVEGVAPEAAVARLKYDGWLRVGTPQTVKSSCPMTMTDFPFDKHVCTFTYVCWMYPSGELTLEHYGEWGREESADGNQEWNITSMEVVEEQRYFGVGYWHVVEHRLTIERRPRYYKIILVMPIYLTTAVVLLGLFSPDDSGLTRVCKVDIALTGLLAHAVILITVTEQMPKTHDGIPYLGEFMIYEIYLCGFGILVATLILYLQSLDSFGVDVPKCIRLLCCQKRNVRKVHAQSKAGDAAVLDEQHNNIALNIKQLNSDAPNQSRGAIPDELAKQVARVHELMGKIYEESQSAEQATTWTKVCFFLDIVLLILFQVANIIVAVVYSTPPV